jgi:hypothetical protein
MHRVKIVGLLCLTAGLIAPFAVAETAGAAIGSDPAVSAISPRPGSFAGGTMTTRVEARNPRTMRVRVIVDVDVPTPTDTLLNASACTLPAFHFCATVNRQRSFLLNAGHHHLVWALTLTADQPIHGIFCAIADKRQPSSAGSTANVIW